MTREPQLRQELRAGLEAHDTELRLALAFCSAPSYWTKERINRFIKTLPISETLRKGILKSTRELASRLGPGEQPERIAKTLMSFVKHLRR